MSNTVGEDRCLPHTGDSKSILEPGFPNQTWGLPGFIAKTATLPLRRWRDSTHFFGESCPNLEKKEEKLGP